MPFFINKSFFLAVFISSFFVLRNSQLESDICRLPYTGSLNSALFGVTFTANGKFKFGISQIRKCSAKNSQKQFL